MFPSGEVNGYMSRNKAYPALIRLLVSTIVLVGLISACFAKLEAGLRGTLIVFIAVIAFPVTLLTAIDASRVIKSVSPEHKKLVLIGKVLALPQAVLGTVLIGFGLAYPVISVREIFLEHGGNGVSLTWVVRMIFAALSFSLGIRYVREGLGLAHDRAMKQ